MPAKTAPAAAAAEADGQPRTLTFNGEAFIVPPELPFTCAAFLQEGEMLNAIRGILKAEDVPRFMEASRDLGITAWAEQFNQALEDAYEVPEGG